MIGYDIIASKNALWRRHHGAIIPYHLPHEATHLSSDAAAVLKRTAAFFVRWEESFDELESGEWWHIIRTAPFAIQDLSKNARNQIRRGAKTYEVRRCSREYIAEYGFDSYQASFERYHTFESCFGLKAFQAAVLSCPHDVEFWGVFRSDTSSLDGFAENVVRANACFYSTMWFKPEALRDYAAYALIFKMTDYYLNERKLAYVSDGARSISHDTNVQNFLVDKFRFRKAFCSLHVHYAPLVKVLVMLTFPFRNLIGSGGSFAKLKVLLNQEAIRRSASVSN